MSFKVGKARKNANNANEFTPPQSPRDPTRTPPGAPIAPGKQNTFRSEFNEYLGLLNELKTCILSYTSPEVPDADIQYIARTPPFQVPSILSQLHPNLTNNMGNVCVDLIIRRKISSSSAEFNIDDVKDLLIHAAAAKRYAESGCIGLLNICINEAKNLIKNGHVANQQANMVREQIAMMEKFDLEFRELIVYKYDTRRGDIMAGTYV